MKNFLQEYRVNKFLKSDPWLEARKKARGSFLDRAVYAVKNLVPAVLGKQTQPSKLLRDGAGYVVDLSLYNPKANVEALIDAGVTHFILRMVYVKTFMRDHWDLTEDPLYRTFYERIRAYAKKTGKTVFIGGYIIYCAGVEDHDYVLAHDYTDVVRVAIGGGAYKPDFLMVDDEVNHWIENSKDTYATPTNQVAGVRELVRKLYKATGLVTGWYSAKWFISQTAGGGSYLNQYTPWFDNVNKPVSMGGEGETVPTWWAWYPTTISDVFTKVADFAQRIYLPSGQQEANYLACGNNTKWALWQCTSSFMSPFNQDAVGNAAGLDFSISRLPLTQFNAQFNLTTPALGHTVTFNANGGTGTMDAQTSNVPANLSSNAFTRTDFTFTGWNTSADGSGVAYVDQGEYSFYADITLFAQWKAGTPPPTDLKDYVRKDEFTDLLKSTLKTLLGL